MRWIKPNLRNSLHAIFSWSPSSAAPTEPHVEISMDDIRARMMNLVPESADDERVAIIRRRIRYADSVESLWFLRGELMAILAKTKGEAVALEIVSGVSNMFDDLLPAGLRSRPSPLGKN
jgi:hypothetical protein